MLSFLHVPKCKSNSEFRQRQVMKFKRFRKLHVNQRTIGPVNAHLISQQISKHKTWLQMTEGFSTSFYLISESCSAIVKGTSYTHIPS